jgi:hypothetical protein
MGSEPTLENVNCFHPDVALAKDRDTFGEKDVGNAGGMQSLNGCAAALTLVNAKFPSCVSKGLDVCIGRTVKEEIGGR